MIADAITLLIVSATLAYGVLMMLSYIKFRKLNTEMRPEIMQKTVAVVVAARNEEQNIQPLLQALEAQECSFPFEVIIVDDHSEDRTVQAVQSYWAKRIQIRVIPSNGTGKKDALTTGVQATPAEVILVTDADCIPDPQWVQKMTEQFNDPGCVFVGGMIRPYDADGAIPKALETETIFLQVASAGMYAMKSPNMCNGASMGFTRRLFTEVNGFANDSYVSGDDMLLMQKAKWQYPSGIRWVKDQNAMVETKVELFLDEAIKQRARWLSKIRAYSDTVVNVTGMLFLFMQLQLPLAVAFTLLLGFDDNPFWIGVALKIIVELLLLSLAASFFRVSNAVLMLPVSFVMYCIITIGAIIKMLQGNVQWKGRTWKNGRVR
jgi:biofilm PGA synthesis N-glycosyltransferase PgaC